MKVSLSTQLRCLCLAAVISLLGFSVAVAAGPRNVILMVADGAGYNTWKATSMYEGKWDAAAGRSTQVYDGPGWVKLGCSTYSLSTSSVPAETGQQDPNLVYDPAKAWDRDSGYEWLQSTCTDSAAAATALSTGRKSHNRAINWSDLNQPIRPTMCEAGKAAGKSVGVVTSVPWSHATPAGLSSAHCDDRNKYADIANQMLDGTVMDVVMGAGNPDYDQNGAPVTAEKDYQFVGGEATWQAIEEARSRPDGTYQGFRPVSTKAEFEALLSDPTPARVVGTAQVGSTLQQARESVNPEDPARDAPLNANVPSLVTMTQGALNVLAKNPNGLFLLIEGGAVDWANHSNQPGRMIQEQMDFNAAVQAVVDWVETHSSWEDSLLIITADHETGLLWGPNSDSNHFEPIVDNGPGHVPAMKYNATNHTNSLVPVYARGAGSDMLQTLVVGEDPVRGPYVDNTGVARTLLAAVAPAPEVTPHRRRPASPPPTDSGQASATRTTDPSGAPT